MFPFVNRHITLKERFPMNHSQYPTHPQQAQATTPNEPYTNPVPAAPQPPAPHYSVSYHMYGPQPPQAPPVPPVQAQVPYGPPPQPPAQGYGGGGHGGCTHRGGHHGGGCGSRGFRRRRFRLFKALIVLAVLWFTATMSYRHGGKIVGFLHMARTAKEMGVTHHQRAQLKGIMWETLEKNRKYRAQMRKMRGEFVVLMDKKTLTKQELDDFIKRSVGKLQEMLLANTPNLLKARAVLTPAQRKIFLVRMQQFQRRRARWSRHRRMHHHHAHVE